MLRLPLPSFAFSLRLQLMGQDDTLLRWVLPSSPKTPLKHPHNTPKMCLIRGFLRGAGVSSKPWETLGSPTDMGSPEAMRSPCSSSHHTPPGPSPIRVCTFSPPTFFYYSLLTYSLRWSLFSSVPIVHVFCLISPSLNQPSLLSLLTFVPSPRSGHPHPLKATVSVSYSPLREKKHLSSTDPERG